MAGGAEDGGTGLAEAGGGVADLRFKERMGHRRN